MLISRTRRAALSLLSPRGPLHKAAHLSSRARALSTTAPTDHVQRGLTLLEEGDPAKAVGQFTLAARAGSADGNFYLALAYDNLLGVNARGEPIVEPSPEAAYRCYLRAADGGHAEAMMNLSFCYRHGEGVAQDVRAAFGWLERSAAAGSARALFNAGVALDPLHPPWGTAGDARPEHAMLPKQPERAVEYYRRAVDAGHAKAKVNLGIALYTGTGCEKDVGAAAALWKEAAEEGVVQADFCLKNMEERPGKLENYFE
ncbi:hypothetical protein AB1Y20_001477 [Prymnesium parvum]|uniref:HCP-like protein n=1 Tax=Prymnesium parvum TaxID=97485 RepID=A0AB34KB72_PRYPA